MDNTTRFNAFVFTLYIGFLAVIYFLYSGNLSLHQLFGLGGFVVLAVLAEGYPLQVSVGKAHLSFSGTIFWTLIILFDPFWAPLSALVAMLVSEFTIQRRAINKGLFNAVQTAISVLLGSLAFQAIVGEPGLGSDAAFFVGFLIGAVVHWLANTGQVSLGAKLLYRESAFRFWQSNFRWALLYELTSAPIALAVAYAYQELWLTGLLLVTLPILMMRMAYSQYLKLKKTYRETVRTLVKIIEMHDPYTAGHSDRVATYARMLCEALRLSPATTEKIELAAFLHDLGKINLDLTNIVRKAGKLTEEERRLIRLHSVVSADLANQVSYFKGEIESMIRHHHENWDGSGYPHGLRGEQIPLGSRVILLADAFDAMTTSRVYRDALDIEVVKKEFVKFSGIQFDPRLVPTFLDSVIGDGTNIVRAPMKEPMQGTRARLQLEAGEGGAEVRPLNRGMIG